MILIVDNYDSFVHNIARYFVELGAAVTVRRNDCGIAISENVRAIVISPGPCAPKGAGVSMDMVKQYSGRLPILGVCLGHQAIGEVFGGQVVRAREPMHGEASSIAHDGSGVFQGLPQNFLAGRYHSLVVENLEATDLRVTAHSDAGEIMGLQHKVHPTFGVQFHPESILTEHGYNILQNFLKVVG